MDLLAIKQLYEYYDSNKIEKIYELDQIISSSGMSKETRNGVVRIATQMLKIYLELFEDKQILIDYQQKIKSKQCKGHPAIVFGILCCILKINLKDCLFTYMYSSITNLVQNCIRAIPLGQIEGQKSMYKIKQSFESVYEKLMTLDFEHNFCKNFPGFEIKQMNHEIIHVRLFMS